MKKLFIDRRNIALSENMRAVLGRTVKHPMNPLFVEDRPWEVRFDNLYPNVIYNDEQKLYQCWYSPFIRERDSSLIEPGQRGAKAWTHDPDREMAVCYAYSHDGLRWEKPELGLVAYDGDKRNNIVLRDLNKKGIHGAGIIFDRHDPDPDRRYKAIFTNDSHNTMRAAFSPDGILWSEPVNLDLKVRGDTHNNAFFDEHIHKYVLMTRNFGESGRLVERSESADFLSWTKPQTVLSGVVNHQTYSMPCMAWAGGYIGLPSILNTGQPEHPLNETVTVELAWSEDGINWERICAGQALIGLGERLDDYPSGSDPDAGCIFAAVGPVMDSEGIRLYYGGSNYRHKSFREGALCLATLPPDGFAGLTSQDGRILTRPFICRDSIRVSSSGHIGVRMNYEGGYGEYTITSRGFDMDIPNAARGKPGELEFFVKDGAVLYSYEI